MNDIISIIIPVYNTKRDLLVSCLQSVLNQTYHKLEIIIINDGSDCEDTIYVCQNMARRYKNIVLVSQKNKGTSYARYVGVGLATGKYLMFVDSDDTLPRTACAKLYSMIEEYKVEMVSGQIRDKIILTKDVEIANRYEILCMVIKNMELIGWTLCGKIFITSIMKKQYYPFEDIYYGEDLIAEVEYLCECKRIWLTTQKVYNYITNPMSTTHIRDHDSPKRLSLCRMWEVIYNIYKTNNIEEAYPYIRAYYLNSVFSSYLLCAYNKYPNYKEMMKTYKRILNSNQMEIVKNPFIKNKYKYFIAIYLKEIFLIKHKIKGNLNKDLGDTY